MKKLLIGVIAVAIAFSAGAYASANGWLNFTGDNQIEQSDDHVNEIMQILREVNQDKLTAEEALSELEDLNPSGLAKQNKELREQVAGLENDVDSLTSANDQLQSDLTDADQTNEDLRTKVTELTEDNEWLSNKVGVLENENSNLSESNQELQGVVELRDNTITGLEEQLSNAADPEYVQHLENELSRANEVVQGHNATTGEAVEEARAIGGE